MGEIIFIGGAILLVVVIIGLTVYFTMTKKYEDGNALEEIQHLSDLSIELVETAEIYKKMGMEKESQEAYEEAARLNSMVWEVINGANK